MDTKSQASAEVKTTAIYQIHVYMFATILIFILLVIQWRLNRRHLYELAAKIRSGGTEIPLIGHAHYFFGDTERILTSIIKLGNDFSPGKIWLCHKLFIGITKPEDVEVCFNSPHALGKGDLYKCFHTIVGEGLITAPVPKWKKNRKIILPTFNQKILDGFVEVFVKNCNIMVDLLPVNATFDVRTYLGRCGLDVISETSMGIQINAQTTDCLYLTNTNRLMDILSYRTYNFYLHPDFIYKWTSYYKEEKELAKYILDFTSNVIADKKADYERRKGENIQHEGEFKRKMFLELLIELSENGAHFTDQELMDEVNTFMVAGTDTSVTVTSFIFLMLGMHPAIQEKVYDETIEILGEDGILNYTDLPKLKYVELVIKETMRLFPISPLVVRQAAEDIKLKSCTIPKGAGIVIGTIVTHRNPEYYKDPLKFIPDRFLPEQVAKRHPYSYYPFTLGPRKCFGQNYGFMLIKTILSTVIRKFKIETHHKRVEDIRLKTAIVLNAVDGYPIKLIPRKVIKNQDGVTCAHFSM